MTTYAPGSIDLIVPFNEFLALICIMFYFAANEFDASFLIIN